MAKGNPTMKLEILNKLTCNLDSIKGFGVKRIGVFGSVIRGDTKGGSDVDILVEFEEGDENFSNLINLYFYLKDLLARKIDLVTKESISPYLEPYILDEVKYIEASS
jgi:predicted nucleotidyltransferase